MKTHTVGGLLSAVIDNLVRDVNVDTSDMPQITYRGTPHYCACAIPRARGRRGGSGSANVEGDVFLGVLVGLEDVS